MVIVNQSKDNMINSQYIVNFYREYGKDKDDFYKIYAKTVNNNTIFLGIYYSIERADLMMTELLKCLIGKSEAPVFYMFDD